MLPRARANIHDPIALADGLLVVLHHEHGVPEVPEPEQGVDEAAIVSLVQPDRRLVEHVERADETGPDLGREANALCLTTGERAGRARQREVVEPHVQQEAKPCIDLLHHPLRDEAVPLGELQTREEVGGLTDRHCADLSDVPRVHRDSERGRLEPCTATRGTGDLPHVRLVLLARPVALGSFVAAPDPRDHALVRRVVLAHTPVLVAVLHRHVPGSALEHHVFLLGGQLLPRHVEFQLVLLGNRLEHAVVVLRVGRAPWRDSTLGDRQVRVRYDELGIHLERGAEAITLLAGAIRRVEREVARRRFLERGSALGARKVLREREQLGRILAVLREDLHLGNPLGEPQRGLQRIGEAPSDAFAHYETVDHDLDMVLLVPGEALVTLEELRDVGHLAVDAGAHKPLSGDVLEQRGVLSLAATHHGGEHLEAGPLGQREDAVHDLLRRLARQAGPVVRAVLHTNAGEQQPQVVVHLGDGADRGAGVAGRRLLVDGDRRGQALDEIHIGLVHLAEELARIGTERLDVAALALGIDGVEREARLARSGQAGEHDESIPRQVDPNVLEVVLPGAPDHDLCAVGHVSLPP